MTLKDKIIDMAFNFEDEDGTFKASTIFLKDLFEIPEIKQLLIHGVVDSKRIKAQDLINAYQAGAIEQKGINPDVINLEYLKNLQVESDKWLKRYTE